MTQRSKLIRKSNKKIKAKEKKFAWLIAVVVAIALRLGPTVNVIEASIEPAEWQRSGFNNDGLLVPVYTDTCASPVKIMPLGDSITVGASSGVDETDKQIGYRKDLWDSLIAAGYNVDFVGSQVNGEFYQPTEGFDPNHEGWSGKTDLFVATKIYNWLVSNPADIVLLHIGTNDLDSNPDDVEDILDEIDRYETDNNTEITVILARIINRRFYSQTTTDFNDNVEAMALNRIAGGDNIVIVDMEDGAGLIYDLQPTGDMWDNLHPYSTGYTKMAGVWFDALDNILSACDFAPTFTSTPVTSATEDVAYSYDVSASDSDAGDVLTITATTLLPGWLTLTATGNGTADLSGTPTNAQVGSHNVELLVEDTAGLTDTQTFTITVANVNDAPMFTSTPVTSATEDVAYSYNITALDDDAGDVLTITAPTLLPGWLTLTATGNGTADLSGTPTNAQVGSHNVELLVEDTAGLTDTQTFSITVSSSGGSSGDHRVYLPIILNNH